MSISEKIQQAQQARQSGQGFGNQPRPERPQQPPAADNAAIVPAARVESAKALNLSLQKSVQEFGELAQNYEQAAAQTAEQIADWMTGALSGENFAAKVLNATAQKLQERQEIQVAAVSFEAPKATSLDLFERHFGKALGNTAPKQIGGSEGGS